MAHSPTTVMSSALPVYACHIQHYWTMHRTWYGIKHQDNFCSYGQVIIHLFRKCCCLQVNTVSILLFYPPCLGYIEVPHVVSQQQGWLSLISVIVNIDLTRSCWTQFRENDIISVIAIPLESSRGRLLITLHSVLSLIICCHDLEALLKSNL